MVAQRKVTTLLRFGAKVTVVSPQATQRLRRYAQRGVIRHVPRRFKSRDLEGAWLVYAATDEQPINELVYRTATKARIFTNVVDQKPLCSFIAPAILKRGDLVIAVSTGGASPTVAKRLRRELSQMVGPTYARLVRLLDALRPIAKRRLPGYHDRKRYFDRLVGGRVFELVRQGKPAAARRAALTLLEHAAGRNGS
jgi:siroheme synthase-like protein